MQNFLCTFWYLFEIASNEKKVRLALAVTGSTVSSGGKRARPICECMRHARKRCFFVPAHNSIQFKLLPIWTSSECLRQETIFRVFRLTDGKSGDANSSRTKYSIKEGSRTSAWNCWLFLLIARHPYLCIQRAHLAFYSTCQHTSEQLSE